MFTKITQSYRLNVFLNYSILIEHSNWIVSIKLWFNSRYINFYSHVGYFLHLRSKSFHRSFELLCLIPWYKIPWFIKLSPSVKPTKNEQDFVGFKLFHNVHWEIVKWLLWYEDWLLSNYWNDGRKLFLSVLLNTIFEEFLESMCDKSSMGVSDNKKLFFFTLIRNFIMM